MTKSDVIHETGCCLCGGTTPWVLPRGCGAHKGMRYCGTCWVNFGSDPDADTIDAEITRRKSAPSPLPEFRAKVGDWIESPICAPNS